MTSIQSITSAHTETNINSELEKKKMEVMKHFVTVHGVGHGAWVYYKLKPRIEAAGHRFTAVNLAASGINEKKLEEVRSSIDYAAPLLEVLDSVPENEKVILVGHSGGGMTAAVGMEKFPNKISLAVFLNAIMPDTKNRPSYVLEEVLFHN